MMKKFFAFFLIFTLLALSIFADSLWANSSNSGFKNLFTVPIASKVGDTITVEIYDTTTTNYSYNNPNYSNGLLSILGGLIKSVTNFDISKLLPIPQATSTVSNNTTTSNNQSQFETQMAAMVTKVYPNGNLQIKGKRDIKVDNSMREIQIEGIVSPNDIQPGNIVNSANIANLEIWYDGNVVFQQGVKDDTWITWLMNSLASIVF
jgi:flagellar L-ring protein precursor FlgH